MMPMITVVDTLPYVSFKALIHAYGTNRMARDRKESNVGGGGQGHRRGTGIGSD